MQLCYMQFWEYFNEICILHLPNKTVFLGIYIYRRSRHWCLSQFDWNLFLKVGEWYCNNSKTYDNKSFGLENIFPLDSRALFLDVHLGKQLYDHPKTHGLASFSRILLQHPLCLLWSKCEISVSVTPILKK